MCVLQGRGDSGSRSSVTAGLCRHGTQGLIKGLYVCFVKIQRCFPTGEESLKSFEQGKLKFQIHHTGGQWGE